MIKTKLLLLFCVCIWGWTFVATKLCLAYFDPISIVGLRFLIGLPVLFVVLKVRGIPLGFARKEFRSLAWGALLIGFHFLIQAYALNVTSATNTGWIITVTPLVLATLGYVFLKESISRNTVLGILIATTGILLLISDGNITRLDWLTSVGDWLILLSAHTWALYTIVTRDLSRRHNPLAVTLYVFMPVMACAIGFSVWSGGLQSLATLPVMPWVALLFLGVLGTLAQWFWQYGVATLGATRAGVFLYLEPIATTALAIPLLDEPFTFFTGLGGTLVLAGVWWSQH